MPYFSPQMLEQEFELSGFRIDTLYPDVAGNAFKPKSDEMAVVARK
jgi:hypothetical protein